MTGRRNRPRPTSPASEVKAAARRIGFDAVGICDLRPIEHRALRAWLARGYGGSMAYLRRQAAARQEPQRIVPAARRAVVVIKNYYQQGPDVPVTARVARYAWGEDYHRVLADKLAALAAVLMTLGSAPAHTRTYVDAGPVPERELAQRAGLGWIAKNTMLINPGLGSYTFIGSVFTDLALDVDPPFTADRCGSCRRCLDGCPTGAFPQARILDATRCISYLTIEQRGRFDPRQGRMIGNWLFGCDICQDVCPWNAKFAPPTDEPRFAARPELTRPDPQDFLRISAAEFRRQYGDTALERARADGLARNAAQVMKNEKSS